MRKFFTLIGAALVSLAIQATERVVWSGNHPVSWNQETYVGGAITVYNFSGLAAGDKINVYGTPQIEGVQYELQYKDGNSWTWTKLEGVSVENNVVSYVVASASIATYIADRGLIVTGCGYDVTKVTVTTGNGQKEVWRQDEMHIYYVDGSDNNSFDTRPDAEQPGLVDFSSLRPGYTLKVYTENPAENPSYKLQYKAGGNWAWTSIVNTVDVNGVMNYEIASLDVAQEIRDRGLVVNGDGYYINRISVESAATYTLWEGSISAELKNWWWLNGQGYLVSDVSNLKAGDKLLLTISATNGDDRQIKICNQETEGETPTFGNIYSTTLDSEGEQTVEVSLSEANVTALKSGFAGIIATGTGCTLTKIELQKADKNTEEHTLWKFHGKQISWNNDYYPGTSYDTYNDMTLGVAAGSIIRAHITIGLSSYSYNVQYKTGNNWSWEDLIAQVDASGTVGSTTEITYTVPDAEHAALIAERGLVFKGQGYDINRITIEVPAESLTSSDEDDPTSELTQLKELAEPVDFTINRTIYCDGYYNTLCLPFNLASLDGTPLEDATVMEYSGAEISGTGSDLTLDVTIEPATSIEAGKPYLVSFPSGSNITSMTFRGVTISTTTPQTIESAGLNMVGILAPTNLTDTENMLFLGENNTLYWSDNSNPLKGFRAYFEISAGSSAPIRHGMAARIVQKTDVTTAAETVTRNADVQKHIVNGQLIIIRDGIRYNALGQAISK